MPPKVAGGAAASLQATHKAAKKKPVQGVKAAKVSKISPDTRLKVARNLLNAIIKTYEEEHPLEDRAAASSVMAVHVRGQGKGTVKVVGVNSAGSYSVARIQEILQSSKLSEVAVVSKNGSQERTVPRGEQTTLKVGGVSVKCEVDANTNHLHIGPLGDGSLHKLPLTAKGLSIDVNEKYYGKPVRAAHVEVTKTESGKWKIKLVGNIHAEMNIIREEGKLSDGVMAASIPCCYHCDKTLSKMGVAVEAAVGREFPRWTPPIPVQSTESGLDFRLAS